MNAATRSPCPLWVKSRHLRRNKSCPLYPQQRTCTVQLGPEIGFSRAVRVGAHISVAGTAPISPAGGNAALGDVYGQTKRCLEIIDAAIVEVGGALQDVTRTRVMLVDMALARGSTRAWRVFRSDSPGVHFRSSVSVHRSAMARRD
jgi:enamine deaminase RidA (YjgF/YER057c/UK114 family)